MRLWAVCQSMTLDEYVGRLGEEVEVAFGLAVRSILPLRDRDRDHGWPYDLTALGPSRIVQIPAMERGFTAVTGRLQRGDSDPAESTIDSELLLTVVGSSQPFVNRALEATIADGVSAACQALGVLTLVGHDLAGPARRFVPARVYRFQSLCLRANDPRFGEWFDVSRYGDLGSDPDVIAASVCLAEVEPLG